MDEQERMEIEQELDRLADGLDAERFRHVAGLEPSPSLVSLFQGSRAAHRTTVAALREGGAGELADRVAALRAERAQAQEEEAWRAVERSATGQGPDGPLPLADSERAIAREPNADRRRALAQAAAEACEEASAPREAAVEARARARAEVGLAPDWRAVVEADGVLGGSDDAWRDLLAWLARGATGVGGVGRGLARADLLRILSLEGWDGHFRKGMLPIALRATFAPLRLDAGRVKVDEEARPGKWPGVHVFGARISWGVRAGAVDWIDLLDGLGRALAASHAPPRLRDPVFGHALGWLLASLLFEPRWLAERCDVDRREATDLVRALRLRRLFALRARAAAFRIAAEVERGMSGRAWRDAYRDAMTSALSAEWDSVRAARDADGPAHRAALAGAGQGEALRRAVVERFDEDWWRNPRTAEHLAALLAAGRLPADEAATPSLAARALAEGMAG